MSTRVRRSRSEMIDDVVRFCRTPQKQSHIIRSCNLNPAAFKEMVGQGVLELHKKETRGRGSSRGIFYWVSVRKLTNKEEN